MAYEIAIKERNKMSKTREMIQFFIDKADAGAGVDYDGMY